MNNPDTRSLLDDLFVDDASEQFRASAMTTLLGAVRRKKRVRKVQGVALALLLLTAIPLAWRLTQPALHDPAPFASKSRSYELVATKVLAPECVVQTQIGGCSIVPTRSDAYAFVESLDSRRFVRALDDEDLLALFAGRAVLLVQRSPGVVEVIFADETLRRGFLVD